MHEAFILALWLVLCLIVAAGALYVAHNLINRHRRKSGREPLGKRQEAQLLAAFAMFGGLLVIAAVVIGFIAGRG